MEWTTWPNNYQGEHGVAPYEGSAYPIKREESGEALLIGIHSSLSLSYWPVAMMGLPAYSQPLRCNEHHCGLRQHSTALLAEQFWQPRQCLGGYSRRRIARREIYKK